MAAEGGLDGQGKQNSINVPHFNRVAPPSLLDLDGCTALRPIPPLDNLAPLDRLQTHNRPMNSQPSLLKNQISATCDAHSAE